MSTVNTQPTDTHDLADVPQMSVTEASLEAFKKLVRKGLLLSADEEKYLQAIPDSKWARIFEVNFNGNFSYAERLILKDFRQIKAIDMPRVDNEKQKITNLERASTMLNKSIDAGEPVLYITDIDNDGSFSQAIINEFLRADPTAAATAHVEYTQVVNGNAARGFTVDHLDKLVQMKNIDTDMPFLIVTADNGINSRDEQDKINARFPNAKLIVTDHHLPDPGMVVVENGKTLIFNPHFNPSSFYQKFNISGAATIGVLLNKVLEKRLTPENLAGQQKYIDNISNLSRVANLLDYVHSDPMDKPEKDYIVTKFLQLQGLMNVNNSLSRIILDGIPEEARAELRQKIPGLDDAVVDREAKNIQTQNYVARILLKIYHQERFNTDLNPNDFGPTLVKEMNRPENFEGIEDEVNRNFIEQLRPAIFGLSVDDEKTAFMEKLCEAMVETYESIRVSEKALATEMRKGQAMMRINLPNSSIGYSDKGVVNTFNRKFLGKVYNDENPGFLAILDSGNPAKQGGSMRSMYDISQIFTEQAKIDFEFEHHVRILTPGHERASGFIIESADPVLYPLVDEKGNMTAINAVNTFINNRIEELRQADASTKEPQLLTDLSAIKLIDRINQVVRGSISNFERIVPLLKVTKDTIWTDSYTTRQYSMKEIADEKRYGYVSIKTDFHDGTVIVPVELIRRLVAGNFNDYLSINYMDNGVFMAERVVPATQVPIINDMRGENAKAKMISEVFAKDFSDKNMVKLNRGQIKDNPFFKYNDFGKSDFNLFERMVIGILDTHRVHGKPIDTLAVFDVEANGFGNGKLMNYGAMNYSIVPGVQKTAPIDYFKKHLFQNQRGREFLLTPEQMNALVPVPASQKMKLPLAQRRKLLMKRFADAGTQLTYDIYYDYPESANINTVTPGLGPIEYVNNHAEKDGMIVYNREIQAEMLAYLVKDDDFKVPQEMTNLTGITQEHLDTFGKKTSVVDAEVAAYYKDKTVLFGAHNTPYDSRILRANAPKIYKTLLKNGIYDSLPFCKEEKLAYDDVMVSSIHGINGLPSNIHFYDNPTSNFSLSYFLADDTVDGYYPDRTGRYLLSREKGDYYLVDKDKHEIVKLSKSENKDDLYAEEEAETPTRDLTTSILGGLKSEPIPNTSVKSSVEALSGQWMTHSLLLSDEAFDIKHVDITKYPDLAAFENQLIFFQDNYLFDSSIESNMNHFCASAFIGAPAQPDREKLGAFIQEYLEINSTIQQKFTDSWMYKAVLAIKDPKLTEINNDLVKLVHFQTQIPTDKIREIFKQAGQFKKKHSLEHTLQHEGHVNGPWEGDHKGDVAFEDKLTLALLARRMYNPYSRDISAALNRFEDAAAKAQLAFDLSHHLSDGAAHDSYSYRQGLLYKRDDATAMIKSIQAKESKLADEQAVHVIKLKLGNDVLPSENCVNLIVKKGVSVSREDIVKDAAMLDFIVVNEQVRSSMDNLGTPQTAEDVTHMLEANDKISLQYKENLSERYRYVEISKRDLQLKSLLDVCLRIVTGDIPKKMPKIDTVSDLTMGDYTIIETILKAQVGLREPGDLNPDNIDLAKGLLDTMRAKRVPTALEAALSRPEDDGFKNMSTPRDPNFLAQVNIKRREPIKNFLFKHPNLRMTNAYLQEQIAEHAQVIEPVVTTPKRGRKMGA